MLFSAQTRVILSRGRAHHPLIDSLHFTTETNNSHASLGYPHVEVLFEPQTASTWMVDKVQNVPLGDKAGDGQLVSPTLALIRLADSS